jgi:hypothetical protein
MGFDFRDLRPSQLDAVYAYIEEKALTAKGAKKISQRTRRKSGEGGEENLAKDAKKIA